MRQWYWWRGQGSQVGRIDEGRDCAEDGTRWAADDGFAVGNADADGKVGDVVAEWIGDVVDDVIGDAQGFGDVATGVGVADGGSGKDGVAAVGFADVEGVVDFPLDASVANPPIAGGDVATASVSKKEGRGRRQRKGGGGGGVKGGGKRALQGRTE